MTWTELVELEPSLAVLATEIVSEPARCGHCSLHAWYGFGGKGFKARMLLLVGMGRVRPGLSALDNVNLEPVSPLVYLLDRAIAERRRDAAWLSTLPEVDAKREQVLRTSDAYDAAYQHLFDLIPVLPSGQRCAGCDRDSVG